MAGGGIMFLTCAYVCARMCVRMCGPTDDRFAVAFPCRFVFLLVFLSVCLSVSPFVRRQRCLRHVDVTVTDIPVLLCAEEPDRKMSPRLLLPVMLGTILLCGCDQAGAVQEVDYEARNYYNGEYDGTDAGLVSSYTDDDVNDDYVITGALGLVTGDVKSHEILLALKFNGNVRGNFH